MPADEKAVAFKKDSEESEKNTLANYKDLAERISKEVLEFKVKTGNKGEVFGSISAEQIQKSLKERGYKQVAVRLEKSLRTLGENLVEVGFAKGIRGAVKVKLLSQS